MNELFNLIKQEKVCLWIGSGMSVAAGYPNVSKLKKLLFESIPTSFRDGITLESELTRIAGAVVTSDKNNSRHKLNEIILKSFAKKPQPSNFHDLLSRIPFFKTIVTTNYDRLLENAFSTKAVVVRKSEDRMLANHKYTTIYKIHGCVDYLDGIVITKSDYDKLYDRDLKSTFWGSIVHEISTKHHLFIGYGYEDGNIISDFERALSTIPLGAIKRYHISPPHSLSPLKQRELNNLGIQHIDLEGEEFINLLIQHLKQNLSTDVINKLVDIEAASQFFHSFDFQASFHITPDTAIITALEKTSGVTEHKILVSISEADIAQKFQNFLRGEDGVVFSIDPTAISKFQHLVEDFNITGNDDLSRLEFKRIQSFEGRFKLLFKDDQAEIDDVCIKVYKGRSYVTIQVEIHELLLTIRMSSSQDIKFDIDRNLTIKNIKHALIFFNCIKLIADAKPVTVIRKGKGAIGSYVLNSTSDATFLAEKVLLYESLRKIENEFDIQFDTFNESDLTEKDYQNIHTLRCLIDEGLFVTSSDTEFHFADIPIDDSILEAFEEKTSVHGNLVMIALKESKKVKVLGISIPLGLEKIIVYNPAITSLDLPNKKLSFTSKSKEVGYTYERFPRYRTIGGSS